AGFVVNVQSVPRGARCAQPPLYTGPIAESIQHVGVEARAVEPLTLTPERMSRRRLLGVLFAAAGGTVVAACGQASTPAPGQPPGGAQPTAVGAEAKPTGISGGAPSAATPTVPTGAKVVTFWIPWGQPERQKWVDDWGAKFREKYPDQALKMEFVGFAN